MRKRLEEDLIVEKRLVPFEDESGYRFSVKIVRDDSGANLVIAQNDDAVILDVNNWRELRDGIERMMDYLCSEPRSQKTYMPITKTKHARDFDRHPYSPDEERVAKYISDLTGIGGGDDPIGFLIASHRTLVRTTETQNKVMNRMDKEFAAVVSQRRKKLLTP